jgi:hypothetical protein
MNSIHDRAAKNRSWNVLPHHIQVHLIPSDLGLPLGGVGEPAVPPIARAVQRDLRRDRQADPQAPDRRSA